MRFLLENRASPLFGMTCANCSAADAMDAFDKPNKEQDNDGRDQERDALRRRRVRRRGDSDIFEQGHGQEATGDDPGRKTARSVDRGRSRTWHPPLGDGSRRDALHALVPPDDRLHRREARLVP